MENDPAVRASGFRKAILEELPGAKADFLPDAYAIRHEERIIDLIEAVDTNPISRAKASLIAELWDHADERGWQVMVIGYDACGGLMFEMPGNVFCSAFLQKFMGDDTGNAIPAAMAVHREMLSRPAKPSSARPSQPPPAAAPHAASPRPPPQPCPPRSSSSPAAPAAL